MFDELIVKIANGGQLSELEKDQLRLEAKRLQDAASLINSIIKPGTSDLQIDRLSAQDVDIQNGNVSLDSDGISMVAEGQLLQDNAYKFVTANGKSIGGWGMYYDSTFVAGNVRAYNYNQVVPYVYMDFGCIGGYTMGRAQLFVDSSPTTPSAIINVVQYYSGLSHSEMTGLDYILFRSTSNNPETPVSGDLHYYVTASGKFVFVWNDAGTIRYKYLDLTGTTVTWVHSTTPPA